MPYRLSVRAQNDKIGPAGQAVDDDDPKLSYYLQHGYVELVPENAMVDAPPMAVKVGKAKK